MPLPPGVHSSPLRALSILSRKIERMGLHGLSAKKKINRIFNTKKSVFPFGSELD